MGKDEKGVEEHLLEMLYDLWRVVAQTPSLRILLQTRVPQSCHSQPMSPTWAAAVQGWDNVGEMPNRGICGYP